MPEQTRYYLLTPIPGSIPGRYRIAGVWFDRQAAVGAMMALLGSYVEAVASGDTLRGQLPRGCRVVKGEAAI